MTPTRAKVNSGVQVLQRATLEVVEAGSVRGEKHHVFTQVASEQLHQVAHVVVVAGQVAAVFVLHLDADDGTPVLVEIRLHHGQQLPHPLVYCSDVV